MNSTISRRDFLARAGATAFAAPFAAAGAASAAAVPSYLKGYEALYAKDPRAAAVRWFREAKFGLFLHYGLYSILQRHEWVQLREKIPVAEYANLKDRFDAKAFDADFITDLALAAGMRYVNITTRHHDSFCLFETKQTDFHSVNSPAKRDLVGELAGACRAKGLGFCLYYSHGRDWRHPHAPNNDVWGGRARPDYDPPDPSYACGADHDLNKYLDFMAAQITELLTNYGPVAAIWLDGIAVPLAGDRALFRCPELYDMIRGLQPQVLVSYKQGLIGTEDFFAPEHGVPKAGDAAARRGAIADHPDKPLEICSTLQEKTWGYTEGARHLTVDEAMEKYAAARVANANLLLNTGPLPDGSIHPTDAATFRAMGKRIAAG